MASGWKQKLARVSQMDWEEVRVRVAQEAHKHGDLLRHRVGFAGSEVRSKSPAGAATGQFFFSGSEIPKRAALLRQHLPDDVSQILRDADEICEHRFQLLGYENLDYGVAGGDGKEKEIDWHLDRVHDKRAPMDPWFKIPFLDFSIVGDHKVTWELNRHQHLVTLAKARLLSGDAKYSRELAMQWRDWTNANPYPLGMNWGSSLEVAFRSLSWIWVEQLLTAAPECADFRAEMMPALAFHGRYIEKYLSTYFSPNTHLLGEAVALFFLGTLYPQIPGSARWKKSGWEIVLHEAKRQVRPDGVYFEQSLHYHVYALDFFLYARLLAARNEVAIPASYDEVLGRMLDVVAALSQAGPAEGFGDDDGGRLFNPRRNHTEHTADPLALGAMIYSRPFSAARLTEEAVWLFGDRTIAGLSTDADPEKGHSEAHSIAFPDGGIYVMADSKPFAQTMAIDAGPQGVGRSGHGHADALSLRLTMDGRRWLVDSGSGVYISEDPTNRNRLRGTGAHNTLRVDGQDQAIADEAFSWTHIPTTLTERWLVGKTFKYFVGSHDGYERLADPVVHRRHVFKVQAGPWLVRDVVLGCAEHELELNWHFARDLEVRSAGPGRMDISAAGSESKGPALSLVMPEGTIWQTATEVGEAQISPAYGALQTAPLVRCKAQVTLPAEIAAALVPYVGTRSQRTTSGLEHRFSSTTSPLVQEYELNDGNDSQQFFFALDKDAWISGPWSSDARVLYYRVQKERLLHLVVIQGTFVSWQGQPLLKAARPSTFFEWREGDTEFGGESGVFSVTTLFEELAGGLVTSANQKSNLGSSSRPHVEKH